MSQPNLDCPKIQKHLALYAGRDLEQPLCLEVEAHLALCAGCRDELARSVAGRERIAVLGEETSRALKSIELWPALNQRLAQERAALRPAAAFTDAAPRSRPNVLRRRWIPISIAAAAALMLSLRWGFDTQAPPTFVPAANPIVPAEAVAKNQSAAELPAGALRRANPGEERLRDSSAPLDGRQGQGRPFDARGEPNSLAGVELR